MSINIIYYLLIKINIKLMNWISDLCIYLAGCTMFPHLPAPV